MKVLFVDNFDSFTYNVVHLLAAQAVRPEVVMNDDPMLREPLPDGYGAIVIGPGPGNPGQTPAVVDLIRREAARGVTVFGVCFGLQAIAQAFGGRIVRAPVAMHGKTSSIVHCGTGMFQGVPSPLTATRYHSLCVDEAALPDELEVTARSEDGVIQAARHRTLHVSGVQFHPESVLSEYGGRIVANVLRLDSSRTAMVESQQ